MPHDFPSTALPAGMLVAIGGAEDKTADRHVLKAVMVCAAYPPANVEVAVIASASRIPDQVLPGYVEAFGALGAGAVHPLAVPDRAAANHAGVLAQVRRSDVIFLTGGDQSRLTAILAGTELMDVLTARYTDGAVVAGTSAGAAAMSATMIAGGDAIDALARDHLQVAGGLGLLTGAVLDTHFLERGRFTRLMAMAAINPGLLGVGLGEDAAVIVHGGRTLEAIGPGHVMILDGRGIGHTNAPDIPRGAQIALEGVRLHALAAGYGYDIEARVFLTPATLDASVQPRRRTDPTTDTARAAEPQPHSATGT